MKFKIPNRKSHLSSRGRSPRRSHGIASLALAMTLTLLVISPLVASAQTSDRTEFEQICSKELGLAKCIQQIYVFALGFGALLALLMLVLAGYRYMTAQGNASQLTNAKEAFSSAFIGLIILFIAFILLYLINPDLVRFKNFQETLRLLEIKKVHTEVPDANSLVGEGNGGLNGQKYIEGFKTAAAATFIKSISLLPTNGKSVSKNSSGEFIVDAKRVYGLKLELDTTKFVPIQEGTVYFPPKLKIVNPGTMEWVTSPFDLFKGYPKEWQKISSIFSNVPVGSPVETLVKKYGSFNAMIAQSIKSGPEIFVLEGQGSSSPIIILSDPPGGLYFPESESNKKIEITVEVLAQNDKKEFIKDQKKMTFSVTGVNREPVMYVRECIDKTINNKSECSDTSPGLLASWGSKYQIFSNSSDGKNKTFDPDGDKFICLFASSEQWDKSTFRFTKPENCAPGSTQPWYNRYAGTVRVDGGPPPYSHSAPLAAFDGTLYSQPKSFNVVFAKELGKIYQGDSCGESDKTEDVTYFSGMTVKIYCVYITPGVQGRSPVPWHRETFLSLIAGDLGNTCNSSAVGPNGVVKFAPQNPPSVDYICENTGNIGFLNRDGYELLPVDGSNPNLQ